MKAFVPLLTVAALALLAACGDSDEPATTASPTRTTLTSRRTTASSEPSETPDALDSVCPDNPDPASNDVNQVDIPNAGDVVASPVTVQGRVAAFEATFRITIFDAAGNAIADETAMSAEGQTLAPFQKDVAFSVTKETPACLWVYESSARDGSPIHVRQTPLVLLP
jgi:hypothetical protein